ncbi:MAG TPA: BamA/TamA family outer membrane protein, partial [Myxococcaceae bacterium]|nr:BamA/TamA family outer membrane protein [Myxococcaceae bacterium]
DLRLTSSLQLESRIEQAYQVPIGGQLRTGVIWQPHPDFSVFPSYNLQAFRIRYSSERLAGVGTTGSGTPDLTFGCTGTCILSFLEQIAEWDRRDDRQAPKSGYYLGLSFQEGGGPLGGDFDYIRIQPDLRYYYSFGAKREWTLALKARAGTLIPLGDRGSPIVSRFFGGGANSMRGFSTRRFSPLQVVEKDMDLDPDSDDAPGETVPIGGNSLFETSAEVRWNFYGNIVFATFLDSGFVTASSFRRESFNAMQYAVGFGFRYITPIGPVRLDFARRLNIGPPLRVDNPDALAYDYGSGCFGFGNGQVAGLPEGSCTFFLSIGEAF